MTRLVLGLIFVLAAVRDASADRIREHLRGALAYVEARDVSGLSASQRALRARSIAALEGYIERGEFPRRTGDPYGARRPRFIDDRGVHCAVGFLIAASGAPELARAIDEEYEYAFVRQMRSPALLAWADAHGFTVDELARIQPSYDAPPTRDGIERGIEREKGEWILACVGDEPPPAKVTLRIAGDDNGVVNATSVSDGPFARCIAKHASQMERGGGAFSPSPEPFKSTVSVAIPSPQSLLEKWISERTGYGPDCIPKPGAVPAQATIELETGEGALAIRVATKPSNKLVDACIADYLKPRLTKFNRHIKWTKQIALAPRVTSNSVESTLRMFASKYATDCYTAEVPPSITVTAAAKRDEKAFALSVTGNEKFAACVIEKLQPTLRQRHSVGNYFRIDSEVKAALTFKVEKPEEREERLRKAREKQRKMIEAIKRKQPRHEIQSEL